MAIAKDFNAGPIWNNADANSKCPQVCARNNRVWNGNWHTTVQGSMSVCTCKKSAGGFSGNGSQPAAGGGAVTSCSAPATQACEGCSASCTGGKQAYCSGGQDTSGTPMCWTHPKCECR
ncbi:mannan-binding protein [Aestuariivirga sp.]|uniref:mannan-binding protein n=1 Tax=Aestuariivirga sp. TaxID=2650926 RepID=UPI0039E63B44